MMEGWLNCQADLYTRMNKAFLNFKKSPKERLCEIYIQTRLVTLEEFWATFKSTHDQIVREYKPEDLQKVAYTKDDLFEMTQELYTDYKTALNKKLKELCQEEFTNQTISEGQLLSSTSSVKLPKITIPSFSGKYTEWTSFRDMFVSLIHSNKSIDDVQKLHYLKAHLTGEAEQLVRQIPITSTNYLQCWHHLEKRYNNKKYLANCILKRLFSQRSTFVESANALKDLLDTTSDCLFALKNLGIDISSWDIIIIHIIGYKLDSETRKQWELKISADMSNDLPTYAQFSEFLHSRFRALECVESKQRQSTSAGITKSFHVTNSFQCECCSENHKLNVCKKFNSFDDHQRYDFILKNRLCFNCFGNNHSAMYCRIAPLCKICKRKHNTLLHHSVSDLSTSTEKNDNKALSLVVKDTGNTETTVTGIDDQSPVVSCFASDQLPICNQVLLATALVQAEAANGERQTIRALLDQGSQASFVTEATVQYLRVPKVPVRGFISGLEANKNIIVKYMVHLKICSIINPEIIINVQAYVLKTITTFLPNKRVIPLTWLDLDKVQLADPEYHIPNKIDLLMGAEVYGQIIQEGVMKAPGGSLIAQATSLGWILSGSIDTQNSNNIIAMHVCTENNDLLKRFWELESDMNNSRMMTDEEQSCEEYYAQTTERDAEGRYIVKLPFKKEILESTKGDSKQGAVKRLKGLIKRFNKNEDFKLKYTQVIEEYLQMNHMEIVPKEEKDNKKGFYLPHHAVIKEERDTTKLRVVFDASAKNLDGVSLNDMLMIGPSLQPQLRHLVMRWRKYKICLAADIVKMYRQIKISATDADFQRLVWSNDTNKEIQEYRLTRVTFGTAAAPYLAVKTLQQVAEDEGVNYPEVANRIKKDFYMDDLLTGCNSVEEGVIIYEKMNELLKKGGFELQKWMSNNEELLNKIRQEDKDALSGLKLKLDAVVKLLGLTWDRHTDVFKYSVDLPEESSPITKRKIISEITMLYDPLGWLAPSVILAKALIQKLWITGVDWDEQVPSNLVTEWNTYRFELPKLTEVIIPRWLGIDGINSRIELHGFSDASKIAYAAAVYIRVIDSNGMIKVSLITAKTKVAPIKQISIPRLELCGAVLVTRLLVEVSEVMGISKKEIHAWTDSTIVLAWLNNHPSRWQTFVANRVSEILTTLDSDQWSHVMSEENPADYASRGVHPSELFSKKMWFIGPDFLSKSTIIYNKPKDIETNLERSKTFFTVSEPVLFDKYSTLSKLIRVVAYCKRFINVRVPERKHNTTYLSCNELSNALEFCIRFYQGRHFGDLILELKKPGDTKLKIPFKSLNPFIDIKGIVRVGGRLDRSHLSNDTKHPILLPKASHLTDLMINEAHQMTLHGGVQLMLSYLATKYYIIGAKCLVKGFIRKCVKCVRYSAKTSTQLMGQLPPSRVSPSRPFQSSGVDFAGPINVRTARGRGLRVSKGYICIFVCMATKAIHLEVVSDLTTQGFLASFKRFVARRGICTDLWSDNGTNFKGASRELQKLISAENAQLSQDIVEGLAAKGVTWHFIPANAPNFGGLWEAGVKSTKFHLRRVIGEVSLTYEELATVLSQIEACLNSRPLTRINSDSDALDVLTPGHFLVGGPLVTAPDYNFEQCNVSTLQRWQLTQKLMQTFWRRWSQEYLSNCLHRYKWANQIPEPEVGDVVLIKEENLPPCRWLLGRVVIKHIGRDNLTRVVSLQTQNSIIKRPTSKLCVLPLSQ